MAHKLVEVLKKVIKDDMPETEALEMSRHTRNTLAKSYRPDALEQLVGVPVEIHDEMGTGKINFVAYPLKCLCLCLCKDCIGSEGF